MTGQVSVGGNVVSDMTGTSRSMASLDMVGGALALDFANTINSRHAPQHDYLGRYEDLLDWAGRAGILGDDARVRLARRAAVDPRGAARVLDRALALREQIYGTFSRVAAGDTPQESSSRAILRHFGTAVSRATLRPKGPRTANPEPPLTWPLDASLGAVLDPIAWSAGQLLLELDGPPLKECPGCGWLFLDGSRNSSRRWCDMQTCGSRDKMRRYYRARRGTAASEVSSAGESQ
jgi:predicted RNA-binding Zn ribbon-like protein